MITSLRGIAFSFFRANKFLVISSIASIALSVFLIVTMTVFSSNAKQSLVNEMKKLYGDMDLSVGYNADQSKFIDSELLSHLISFDEIQDASAVLIDRLIIDSLNSDFYTIGVDQDELVQSRYHFTKKLSDEDIIMNASLAKAMNAQVGDIVYVENRAYTLIEILEDLNTTGTITDIIIVSREQLKRAVYEKTGIEHEATFIVMKAKQEEQITALAQALRNFDQELRIDLAQDDEFYKLNLQSLTIFMIVMSILVLIVSTLFIYSNSDAFLYKYKNQMAIMRTIGASRSQIFKVSWIQYSLINLAGSATGFSLAIVCNQFMQNWLGSLFSYDRVGTAFQLTSAFLVTIASIIAIQLFMVVPAYRSSKILPIKIMELNERNDFSKKKIGKVLGFLFLIFGFFTLFFGFVHKANGSESGYFLLGAMLLLLGVFRLVPVYLPSFLMTIAPAIQKLFGHLSYISIRNVIPQIRKNTMIILTISVLMIITVMGSAIFKMIVTNEETYLKGQFPTDIVVKSRLGHNSTIDHADIEKSVNALIKNVEWSTLSTAGSAYIKNNDKYVAFNYGLASLNKMASSGLLPKQVLNEPAGGIILTAGMAERYKLQVGDRIELGQYSEERQSVIIPRGSVEVKAIHERLPGGPYDALMDWSNSKVDNRFNVFEKMFIHSSEPQNTLAQLEELKRLYPGQIEISSYEQAMKKSKEMFIQRWSIFIAVLVIVLISVMMGVCNMLIHNIHSKRREFAILRTISVTERGIQSVILIQVTVYLLTGIMLGIGLGMLLAYIVSLIDSGFVQFDYKTVGIVSFVMLGIAYTVVTVFIHSIRKSKLTSELILDNK